MKAGDAIKTKNDLSVADRVKTWAAWILLSLPLVVYPLFWVRVFRSRLVAWDRVTLITLPVLAVFAAAVLLLTGFSRLRRKCAVSGLNLLLVLFAADGLLFDWPAACLLSAAGLFISLSVSYLMGRGGGRAT